MPCIRVMLAGTPGMVLFVKSVFTMIMSALVVLGESKGKCATIIRGLRAAPKHLGVVVVAHSRPA